MLASRGMLRRLWVAAVVVGCVLVPAAPALASGNDVIKDCVRNGRLTKQYSQQEYRSALANLPTDVDEYTDCRDIIRKGQLGIGGGAPSPPPPGAAGGAPDPYAGATPDEVAAAIARLRDDPALRERLAANGARDVAAFTHEAWAAGMVAALETVGAC